MQKTVSEANEPVNKETEETSQKRGLAPNGAATKDIKQITIRIDMK